MITIVIAEDHQAFIDGIMSYLEYEEDVKIVGFANDGEALLNVVRRKRPKVVLADIRMPKLDGIQATTIIKKEFPEIKVMAFTMFDQTEAVDQMLKAGASGYLLKNSSLERVLEGIRTIAKGDNYFDVNLNLPINKPSKEKSILSSREKEILQLIAQGKSSLEIANILFIGKSTVDTHRKNMIRKLELSGRGELLRYALDMKYQF